jgi:endonuclease G
MFLRYRRFSALFIFALSAILSTSAFAERSSTPQRATAALCQENYYKGIAPNFINPALSRGTTELCFDGFTVMYSSITRTPLWSAEYLTKDRLAHAEHLSRQNNFHEENQLPFDQRATLADYKGSGFDRGHMSPNGDMGTREQQYNSFSLANMVPQNSYNNQNPWRLLEEATRELVKQEGDAYVITGAAFRGNQIRKIGQVLVPSDVYKVVYFPKRQAAGVYFAPNDASGQVDVISLAELNEKIGLDLFPSLSPQIKQQRINMPLSTKMGIRQGDIHSRETHASAAERNPSVSHYGMASSSQTQPAAQGLIARLLRALFK